MSEIGKDNVSKLMRGAIALAEGLGDIGATVPRRTPMRFVAAMREMLGGYHVDVAALLQSRFEASGYAGDVIVEGIAFTSFCEHHLLPFSGTAEVVYQPGPDGVVGLSKIPRLVDAYARRLQVQERMTVEIVRALIEHGGATWAQVKIEAAHTCACARGVRARGSRMVTCHAEKKERSK